jgi:hypothetical protein
LLADGGHCWIMTPALSRFLAGSESWAMASNKAASRFGSATIRGFLVLIYHITRALAVKIKGKPARMLH